MAEYFTEALVLDAENSGEFDKLIYLYTKELGKVVAKAKSIRKTASKLAAHLEPLNFARIRLVEKNGFQVVDALAFNRINISPQTLAIFQFIKEMTFELQPDKNLWLFLRKNSNTNYGAGAYRPILKILGFDPSFARCSACNSKFITCFSKTDQVFFCRQCAVKIPKNEIILIQ